jgi:DNA-binding response OmpR family regulator
MRILIAETDLSFLAEMKQALERAGHAVIESHNGLQAWHHLTGATPPDLLVTRAHLGPGTPPGTALGLYAHASRIPVVYIPANADLARLAEPKHGAVLIKPFAPAELVATVNRLLQHCTRVIRCDDAGGER